jgi:hypothetical protein
MLRHVRDCEGVTELVHDVLAELVRATSMFGKFNSSHEGYAVFLEEVDELWDHVKMKQTKRDPQAMRSEAVQCAAMAIRFGTDCCTEEGCRK